MEREYRGALDVQRESERAKERLRESITSCSERERGGGKKDRERERECRGARDLQ